MAYPSHFLLSYGGTLCGGQEIWSNNIRMHSPTGGLGTVGVEAMLTNAAADIRKLALDPGSRWYSDVKCTWVKFNAVGADGRYESKTESNTLFLAGTEVIAGSQGSPVVPPQIAVAVTFRTARERGPASKGRIFAPRPCVEIGGTGRITSAHITSMATSYATFIKDLGNWSGLDLNALAPAVVSDRGAGGAAEWITRVEVGDVADTQRRRRNALLETRVGVNVPSPV